RAVRRAHRLRAERQLEPERKPTADRGSAHHEGAAIHLGNEIHDCLPAHALAAMWIASRTCWKVPQRQIFVIASSMSASVGLGFSLRSAATAMIMPLWQ